MDITSARNIALDAVFSEIEEIDKFITTAAAAGYSNVVTAVAEGRGSVVRYHYEQQGFSVKQSKTAPRIDTMRPMDELYIRWLPND